MQNDDKESLHVYYKDAIWCHLDLHLVEHLVAHHSLCSHLVKIMEHIYYENQVQSIQILSLTHRVLHPFPSQPSILKNSFSRKSTSIYFILLFHYQEGYQASQNLLSIQEPHENILLQVPIFHVQRILKKSLTTPRAEICKLVSLPMYNSSGMLELTQKVLNL